MCAAPGSKTAQLIEMMNENLEKELPSLFFTFSFLIILSTFAFSLR